MTDRSSWQETTISRLFSIRTGATRNLHGLPTKGLQQRCRRRGSAEKTHVNNFAGREIIAVRWCAGANWRTVAG